MTIMLSFVDFLNSYCLYPSQTLAVYQIWKDLEGKQEITNLYLQDGRYNGFPGYLIYGEANFTKLKRVMIPISADSELDLEWYTYVRLIQLYYHLLKVVFDCFKQASTISSDMSCIIDRGFYLYTYS